MLITNKTPYDVFKEVSGGEMDLDTFLGWYNSLRTKAYSEGYQEASDYAYRNGHGGEF